MNKEKIKEEVKKKLWRFGYGVRDCSGIEAPGFDFDLLVDNKFTVIVKEVSRYNSEKHIVARTDNNGEIFFMLGTYITTSPYEIFGRPKVGVNSEKNKKSK